MTSRIISLSNFCLLLTLSSSVSAQEPPIDFSREVLPILSNKCFVCHGPDAEKGELRLDSREAATADLGDYHAIDPKNPAKSEILNRIHSQDDPMPPEEAEKQLTDSEREVISRWVKQGGEYALHWAFDPPTKAKIDDSAKTSPIDQFIGRKLKAAQIDFAPAADKATLARRVALTLTGLPPEPKQLADFLADTRPDAYERLIEALFQSPRFGEHQARYWLDAVRYGDTHGLHLDSRRGIYPYRDWVVRAYNQNLPLDDFITWQLAGDLLPNPTLDQRLATGYVRLNPSTGEGGAIPAEFQMKNNFDRVETLGTVFLGMSLTCARCHTHKYDPIPQTEYYRLLAFFNSTAEPPMDGNSYTYGPTVRTPENQRDWQAWNSLSRQSESILAEVEKTIESRKPALLEFARSQGNFKLDSWKISKPIAIDAAFDEKKLSAIKGLPGQIAGRAARGKLPNAEQAIWISFNVEVPTQQSLWLTFSGNQDTKVFMGDDQQPAVVKRSIDRSALQPVELPKGKHRVRIQMVGPLNQIETKLANPWLVLAKSGAWDKSNKIDKLLMLSDPGGPLADFKLRARAAEIAGELGRIEANFTTSLVAQDLPRPRETKLLHRGEYHSPVGDPLEPGILKVMSPFPESAPRNRLGLAQWMTSREHPLVSRVMVNRIWQRIFGDGLVRSPEDFGLQGQQPTHPELLDWLAVELQDSGWDLRHMLRLMLTSRTFRQQSNWRSKIDDPENRLFARGPGYRLDAEVIRDVALWGSELLDPHMGGEGVKPYQPGGMWIALAHPASNTKNYVRDKGQLLYRRSLYVYWKRTSPHPMLTLFDAPDRESSCVRRSRTSTSLQSLGLLNETQRIEMGRKLAERVLREGREKGDLTKLNLMFKLIACRDSNQVERDSCLKLVNTMRARYRQAADDALAYLSIGDAARNESLNPAEHAAWSQLAVTFLASDIAILMY